jgi:serine phosphatase RsbU (regulator of sigma subunit)/DNA-binding response OmpR family regulator
MEIEKIKIILLEDDATVIYLVSKTLSSDFDLKICKTIEEFKSTIEIFVPHIVILDLTLPDGNGIDLCTQLRSSKKNKDIAIFIMTGSSDKETVDNCYKAGADDFIRKPFFPSELKSKIEIFKKINKAKKNLLSAYETQLSINLKLYQLSRMVHKNFSERKNIKEIFHSAEILTQIMELEYIEFIQTSGRVHTPVSHKKINELFKAKNFTKLSSDEKFLKNLNNNIYRFKIKTGDAIIHCCCAAITRNSRIYGYILMEKLNEFTPQEMELLLLFTDFFDILSGRSDFENILEKNNNEYKRELTKIRKIQVSMIPNFSDVNGFDIDFAFLPAQEISGDFFDGFFIDENIYQIILCDVSGHGMASAYVGNELRTQFRNASKKLRLPSEIAKRVNDSIAKELKGLFYYATAIIIQIDVNTGTVTYMNAGHPSALISNNRQSLKLSQTGPLIGIYEDNEYTDSIIEMKSGDSMLLYTDGITESRNLNNGEIEYFFGEERLDDIFTEYMNHHPKELIHMVIGSVYEFTDYSEQEDDITAICIKKK